MGLDMYLYVKKYESVSRWDEKAQEKVKSFYPKELQELGKRHLEDNFLSKETRYQVGYWRKANAIHKWFIDHCAKGEDDCRSMWVSVKKLEELLDIIKDILFDSSSAKNKLPTQAGFFFGSQEYDEWYFEDLKYTKDLLERVLNFLAKNTNYEVYYQASW